MAVSIEPLLFEGKPTQLTCTVVTNLTTLIDVNILWSGPIGFITSGSDYTASLVTKINSNEYTSTLVIKELLLNRDNGKMFTCTAVQISVHDPVHILSSNYSAGLTITIDGILHHVTNIHYSLCSVYDLQF